MQKRGVSSEQLAKYIVDDILDALKPSDDFYVEIFEYELLQLATALRQHKLMTIFTKKVSRLKKR